MCVGVGGWGCVLISETCSREEAGKLCPAVPALLGDRAEAPWDRAAGGLLVYPTGFLLQL